jgi:hypothetical protein
LQDLTFIEDGNPDFLDAEKQLINFERRTMVANVILPLLRLKLEPYWFCPVHELLHYLMNARGFENHDSTAYNFSKMIESARGDGGVTEERIIEAPPLMSDDLNKLYATQARDSEILHEGQEIKLLNQRAAVMLGEHGTMRAEREKIWANWCEKIQSDRLLVVASSTGDSSPVASSATTAATALVTSPSTTLASSGSSSSSSSSTSASTSATNSPSTSRRRSTIILSDSEFLEQSANLTGATMQIITAQLTFKEMLVRSRCLEISVESAVHVYPDQDDEELFRVLLAACFCRSIDTAKFMAVIRELGHYRATAQQCSVISSMVATYKDHSVQVRQLQEVLQNIDRTRRKAQGRARGAFIAGQRQNPQLANFHAAVIELTLGLELVEGLSTKTHILLEQLALEQHSLEQMQSSDIAELAAYFVNLQSHAHARLEVAEKKRDELTAKHAAQEEQMERDLEREAAELRRLEEEYQYVEHARSRASTHIAPLTPSSVTNRDLVAQQDALDAEIATHESSLQVLNADKSQEEQKFEQELDLAIREAEQDVADLDAIQLSFDATLAPYHEQYCQQNVAAVSELSHMIQEYARQSSE